MRNGLAILFFITQTSFLYASVKDKSQVISSLVMQKPDSALLLAHSMLKESIDKDDKYGILKSNYYLGVLNRRNGEFGKAIIFYLEAIRYGKNSNNEDAANALYLTYENTGVIFKKFKAYDLAEEYYLKGLEYAKLDKNVDAELSINYNLAGLYRDKKEYSKTIKMLENQLGKVEVGSKSYFRFHNRLARSYHDVGLFYESIEILEKLINVLPEEDWKKMGSSYHNLARSFKALKDYENALNKYSKAIEFKSLNKNKKLLFSSYFGLAETHWGLKDHKKAKTYFHLAEDLLDLQPNHPDYFELYKLYGDLHFILGDYEESKRYEDLYAQKLIEYLDTQAELKDKGESYNMNLITKRYFAEVDKQERVANILMYSRLTSGGLLALLLLVISYHRYQKIRLRKSIERELIALDIVEPLTL